MALHHRKRRVAFWISRAGMTLTVILPLWALWIFAYMSFQTYKSEMEDLPYFYGIHLYKKQVQEQLERILKILVSPEGQRWGTTPAEPDLESYEQQMDQMTLLFGDDQSFLLVRMDGFQVLYPSVQSGDLSVILDNARYREAFFNTLERITESGSQEGYFSIYGEGVASPPESTFWLIIVASTGKGLLGLCLIPQRTLDRSGGILQSAQEAMLQENIDRFLYVTLPVVILSTVLIGFLCFQRKPLREGRTERNIDDREGKETDIVVGP